MNKMVSKLITGFLAVMLALSSTAAQKSDQGEVQLKAAIQKQVVDGNLLAAIEMYQKIIMTYGNNRSVAAQALLRMGQCYEKLGVKEVGEARKAYERAIREFSDQKDVLAAAQARLVALGNEKRGISYRQVWAGIKVETSGSISPDGRYLSYVDWDTGDLALHDFSTGGDRHLTNKGTWQQSSEFAEESAISRDGKQLVYSWFGDKNHCELRIVGLESAGFPQPRHLTVNEDADWIAPHDWSPDGKWITVSITSREKGGKVGLVSTQDGSLRVLKSFSKQNPRKICFSPDGKYLGLDFAADESNSWDVLVLPVDGSGENKAVVSPGQDNMMGWSPDGKRLLFASDRTGAIGLWALPMSGGKPIGLPELVYPQIGPVSLGVTASGALYVVQNLSNRDIQVASLDFSTGKLIAPTVSPVQSFIYSNAQPDWSPDGKYLAYVSARAPAGAQQGIRPAAGGARVLAIRSMETGQVRELRPNLKNFNYPRWMPDGRSFISQGTDLQGRQGIYRIDGTTGEAAPIGATKAGNGLRNPQPSPDGKKIYYLRSGANPILIERDLVSGNERELIRAQTLFSPCILHDGRNIAVLSATFSESVTSWAVLLVPVAGGEPRELLRLQWPEIFFPVLNCTPDGRGVLVQKKMPDGNQLLLVPVDGGQPRKLDNSILNLETAQLSIHPDGKQIAYLAGELKLEVFVLENFLPAK